MEALTIQQPTHQYGIPKYAGVRMEKADFQRWEPDDFFVYEYRYGVLLPTLSMRQDENYLLTNLEDHFFRTAAFQQGDRLRPEMDTWLTTEQMRRPDVSYFTRTQLQQMITGSPVIPAFVIEFASESDREQYSLLKLHDYFDAGVQIVWWVYPLLQVVYVYTSPKTVLICTGDDPLNAAPILPDLRLTVSQLFGQ